MRGRLLDWTKLDQVGPRRVDEIDWGVELSGFKRAGSPFCQGSGVRHEDNTRTKLSSIFQQLTLRNMDLSRPHQWNSIIQLDVT